MNDQRTTPVPAVGRRAAVGASASLAAALAGCSSLLGDGSSPSGSDPDAGTDSYGLRAVNRTDEAEELRLRAVHFDDGVVFDEAVDLDAGGEREWDQVLTTDGQYNVTGRIDVRGPDEDQHESSLHTVQVGGENSPDVANVTAHVYPYGPGEDTGLTKVWVGVDDPPTGPDGM